MAWLAGFLGYNLLASLLAGLLAWFLAVAAVRLLDLRSSARSFVFFILPFFKSLLVLLGVGLVFPWPAAFFAAWRGLGIRPIQAAPLLLAWAVMAALISGYATYRARRLILDQATPASVTAPHLQAIFETVAHRFRQVPCPECSDDVCCLVEQPLQPRLLISQHVKAPLAFVDPSAPAVVFPANLDACLDDDELTGALAHELAHFVLRRPVWYSAGMLHRLAWISPIAGLVGKYLYHQEEKACDRLAVQMTIPATVYAGMLTKSYRFAQGQVSGPGWHNWQSLPGLLGFKPLLSERVEHLLAPAPPSAWWASNRVLIWSLWVALFVILFVW